MPEQPAKKLHILVNGDNASFRLGGEATKPIRFFRGYRARGHDCTLVTHERCADDLASVLTADEIQNVTFLKDTLVQRLFNFLASRYAIPIAPAIPFISQFRLRKILRAQQFGRIDVVHQTTPISPLMPSLLAFKDSLTIQGPLAVLPGYPENFLQKSNHQRSKEKIKFALAIFLNRIWPARRSFEMIYCDNEQTRDAVSGVLGAKTPTRIELNNAVEDHWFTDQREPPKTKPRFVYVGRLIDWKCVDVVIDAASRLPFPVDLVIVGDGPERASLEARCSHSENVSAKFKGWLETEEIKPEYVKATAAVSLALRESGGTSVMEAMASQTPLIATRWGGHTSRLKDGMGLLVTPGDREQMIRETSHHMLSLCKDPALGRRLGKAAQAHAYATMRWSTKIEVVEQDILELVQRKHSVESAKDVS